MTCTCDQRSWPPVLAISQGLDDLPRQLVTFSDLRTQMLARAAFEPALAAWRGRTRDDYGVMLLELWAYVGELVSIYDKAIADESYVRTAKLRPSLRRLVGALGYVPRPAVAAAADVALLAEGVRPVSVPVGTAFRSGAFGAEKPQIFELTAAATIHPALNQWKLATPVDTVLSGSVIELLLDPASVRVAPGDTILVEVTSSASDTYVRKAKSVERIIDDAGRRVAKLTLDSAVDAGTGVPVSGFSIRKATRKASLKSPSKLDSDPASFRYVRRFRGFDIAIDVGTIEVAHEIAAVEKVTTLEKKVSTLEKKVSTLDKTAMAKKIGALGTLGAIDTIDVIDTIGAVAFGPWQYEFILDGIHHDIHRYERMLVEQGGEQRWATVTSRADGKYTLLSGAGNPTTTVTQKNGDGDVTGTIEIPSTSIEATYTWIATTDALDDVTRKASPASPDWSSVTDVTSFTIHYGLVSAGRVLGPSKRTLSPTDPLRALGTRKPVNTIAETSEIILRDAENRGVAIGAGIALDTGVITASGGVSWSPLLATPVSGFGNVVKISRGETVPLEILGDGNGAQSHQAFKLQKKPLTYIAAPGADSGVASTLRVWVDGLLWTEVPTLYAQSGHAQVYVVRQTDDGSSVVTFGDGISGARLPTGSGNVVASYRYGAGAAAPPAGSISQLAKPVTGLKAVVGPLAAGGGADPEPASSLASLAPRSALLLGRAISIDDMEAAALTTPGVITARTDWAWDGTRQRPVVKVWVIGDGPSADNVMGRLAALTEPNTPINVESASAVAVALAVDLELDPRRIAGDVVAAATIALHGWLAPEVIGIDRPLFRSHLIERITSVPGVTGLRGLSWNGAPWTDFGKSPGAGAYFDFSAGLTVTGS